MSASITEAAKANTDLVAEQSNITIKASAERKTMRAGRWDPVSHDSIN